MIQINDFIANVAEQYDVTDASVFTAETKYKDLEDWSSLVALSIILMVDEEYEVTIKAEDIQQSFTIEELYNRVVSK